MFQEKDLRKNQRSFCLLTIAALGPHQVLVKVGVLSLRATGHPQMIQEAGLGLWNIAIRMSIPDKRIGMRIQAKNKTFP